jgi:hypothetical protein
MTSNFVEKIESLAWLSMWHFCGEPVATYKRNETELSVKAVIWTPTPENFSFEGFQLYNDSQIFEIKKADLDTIFPPKEGDTIIFDGVHHAVSRANGSPCWMDVGSFNVSVKVHTRSLR